MNLQYRFEFLLENYLSDMQLLHFKLGVQIEVELGSPQAHMLVETCLLMAGNEQQLRREKYESNLHFTSYILHPSSGSSIQKAETFA